MAESCCGKKTVRSEGEKTLIYNRIHRIIGQLKGVHRMVSEDAYCQDVLNQLSAVENAISSLANHILEQHLYTCVARDLKDGDEAILDELVALFKKFNR